MAISYGKEITFMLILLITRETIRTTKNGVFWDVKLSLVRTDVSKNVAPPGSG
jgi:hypothetical protein